MVSLSSAKHPLLGTKEHPAIVRVPSEGRARQIARICHEHNWHFIAGIEPDKEEDISDIDCLLKREAAAPVAEAVGRNELCPCGSGKKYKRCCRQNEEEQRAEQLAQERTKLETMDAEEDDDDTIVQRRKQHRKEEHTQHWYGIPRLVFYWMRARFVMIPWLQWRIRANRRKKERLLAELDSLRKE